MIRAFVLPYLKESLIRWAESHREQEKARVVKCNHAKEEAEAFVIALVLEKEGRSCIHDGRDGKAYTYCSACPLGQRASMSLSREASRVLCTRRRAYPK